MELVKEPKKKNRVKRVTFGVSIISPFCTTKLASLFKFHIFGQNLVFGKAVKGVIFFTRPCCEIKISKPPYVSFSKMFGLCHFLSLLDLPKRNYM